MQHTNPYRGEIMLELGGVPCLLRPTFAALAEMESATGHSLIALARRLANGEARLLDLAAIAAAGLRGAGHDVPHDLKERITQTGSLNVTEKLLDFLVAAITGDATTAKGA